MRAPTLVLLLLLPLLLLPAAGADHVYSHRYVVLGRVVDADGLPVENATVRVQVRGVQSSGLCAPFPGTDTDAIPGRERNVTDAHGEFWSCIHLHALPAGAAFRVSYGDASVELPVDQDLRQSFVVLRLDASSPQANATSAAASYTVLGRAWSAGNTTLEGVPVRGLVAPQTPVRVTLLPEGGEPISTNATTNAYGDFAVRLPTQGRVTEGRVQVEASGDLFQADVDDAGATYLSLLVGARSPAPTPTTPAASTSPVLGTQVIGTPAPADTGTGNATEPTRDAPLPAALVLAGLAMAGVLARRRERK